MSVLGKERGNLIEVGEKKDSRPGTFERLILKRRDSNWI